MHSTDLITIGEVARRSGHAASAIRYYEQLGLVTADRNSSGQRRFQRSVLRRLAFIRAATTVGMTLDHVRAALADLPAERTPTRADWSAISRRWRSALDERIRALEALRDGLDSCIGCGCLSLERCPLSNPEDRAGQGSTGAAYLPRMLRGGSPG